MSGPSRPGEAGTGVRTVLLAMEDPRLRGEVRSTLCRRHRVEEAADAGEVLRAVRDHPPDLVILGDSRGTEGSRAMADALGSDPARRDVPVVLLVEEGRLAPGEGLPRWADEVVVLPLRPAELEARTVEALRRRSRGPPGPEPPPAPVEEPVAAEENLRRHNRVLVELARSRMSWRGDLEGSLRQIARAAAHTLQVERVSIWLFDDDHEQIHCAELYQRSPEGHTCGMAISRDSHPAYFQALDQERALVAHDARGDAHTRELLEAYLTPLGITSMLDAPIRLRGRMVGVVCHEHVGPARHWAPDEQAFAASVADLVALAIQDRERREAEDALRASEARYRSMVEHIPAVTYSTPALPLDHRIHSPQLDRILGFPPERGKDDPELWADHLHAADRERVISEISCSQAERSPFRSEYRMHTCQGRMIWIRDEGNWTLDDRGGLHLQGVMVDITDRKHAEEALQEAHRRKDRFLAMLAHELRNPLAAIHNSVELFQLHDLAEPDLRWAREVLARQVRLLARLVDDLLDVSRVTLGKVKIRREPVKVSEAVARAMETSGPAIEGRRQRLELVLPPEPLWVEGDLMRLAQVLSNLLNNASKYMGEGGRIRFIVEREGEEVVLRVRDEGMGIPTDMLPRIFEPFLQLDTSLERAQGGLGIGLTLVQSLVRLHGGSVEARSDGPGRGSEFVVRLPALACEEGPDSAEGPPPAAPTVGRRILVVDDNRDAAQSLTLLLQRRGGNEVRCAFDGPTALEEVRAFRPDLVFLDIGLPGMDGYQVARRMRAQEAGRSARVVALSGYGSEEDLRRSQEAGFDRHILKPLDAEKLREVLESLPPARGGEQVPIGTGPD